MWLELESFIPYLHVLAHQVEGDLGVELAEELAARAAGDTELALQLLAVDSDPTKVLVALQSRTSCIAYRMTHQLGYGIVDALRLTYSIYWIL